MKLFFRLLLFLTLTSCFEDKQSSSGTSKNDLLRIKTVYGDILIKLYVQDAPNTVKRIKELVNKEFYDGLMFHRVIPGFVLQGGDPTGTGRGGSGKNIKAEFNHHMHKAGTVAMARSRDINSADSQFYITLADSPHLDGKYTVFGKVSIGLDIAKKILKGDKMISLNIE